MRQASHHMSIRTSGRGFADITAPVRSWVAAQGMDQGLLTLFCPHTSASLVIQENADPDALRDLESTFSRLAPESGHYRHDAEGPDDMPAHIRTVLTQSQLSIPVERARPVLGTWQAIYLWEHRADPHDRELVLHLIGD
jgi:secondary thiamine-phosphate synthase enzyme